MPSFAVIDVETTGLSPAHQHRIVEVAVVLVDENGRVVHEWDTLVNPRRDVGATDVHGLSAAELYDAPSFEEIAGELKSLLEGYVPVAHNWPFEVNFLAAEFARLGVGIPLDRESGLCTMRMAGHYLPIGCRSLAACCEFIGYPLRHAHEALADATATAALLAYYLRRDGQDFIRRWRAVIERVRAVRWPHIPLGSGRRFPRAHHRTAPPTHFLARLSSRAPKPVVPDEVAPYIEALDRALLNREISRHEAEELVSVANLLGLGREDVLSVHRMYLRALCFQAWTDGVVTDEERADLHKVGELLGLPAEDVECALAEAATSQETPAYGQNEHVWHLVGQVGVFRLQRGDKVAFTGEPKGLSRNSLEERSRLAGLHVTNSVSRRTRLLVAADTDSLSGKARRARQLGVPIVDVQTFLRMLDALEGA